MQFRDYYQSAANYIPQYSSAVQNYVNATFSESFTESSVNIK